MKAIHNSPNDFTEAAPVVLYPKDTEKWKQFTTRKSFLFFNKSLFCIPKILKNESNSQRLLDCCINIYSCFVSQRYWKMKAIHNSWRYFATTFRVVLYPKDTEKWKQFTTTSFMSLNSVMLFCIPKILKNESNSQLFSFPLQKLTGCFVSQRYWKMKAIHNKVIWFFSSSVVVLYPKDTEKWKQFTTCAIIIVKKFMLFCIPKILKNEI